MDAYGDNCVLRERLPTWAGVKCPGYVQLRRYLSRALVNRSGIKVVSGFGCVAKWLCLRCVRCHSFA